MLNLQPQCFYGAACSAHSSGTTTTHVSKIMAFSIFNFSDLLRKDAKPQEIIDFFKRKHLLAFNRVCPNCNSAMEMEKQAGISDGYRYN